ncbi:MBL fold metallo-hydrolase, partial [bacterium]|nr:MBL fold metallo-hydrolase [bacterium]
KITTLRVGHGTCHIIQHKNQTTVIDAGSRQNLDVGLTVILPKLRELQVHSIRSLIITHSDLDHVAGIFDILQYYPIGKIVIAPQALQHATPPLKMVLKEAKARNVNIVQGYSGWKDQHGNCKGTIIFPNKEDEYSSPNATSIVYLLRTHGRTILFTGDIDEKRIKELQLVNIGAIDVLELPHHGQWSEESQQFVNEKQPTIVIQSTNRARHSNDQWEIPPQTTRFVTAIDGDLTTVIDTNGDLTTTCSNDPATMEPCYFPSP